MAQKWIEHGLGNGVVLTRQNTALRDGELQSSSFVRMLPGNREQLYPDTGYDHYNLDLYDSHEVIDSFFMNFNGGHNYLVVVTTPISKTGVGLGSYRVFDLDNLVEGTRGLPSILSGTVFSNVITTTLVNRGAEYYLNIASNNPLSSNPKLGKQLIFYIDDSDTLATRDVGLAPSTLTVQTERSFPELSPNLWTREQQSGAPALASESTAYSLRVLTYNHLYGSYALMIEEFETPADIHDAWDAGFGAMRGVGVSFPDIAAQEVKDDFVLAAMLDEFVPISKIALRFEGQGYNFAYWGTEYDETFGVESAPSEIALAVSGDPQAAIWEVTADWGAFINLGNPYWKQFAAHLEANAAHFGFTNPGGLNWDFVQSEFHKEMSKAYTLGTLPQFTTGRFPLSKAQEEAVINRIDLDNQGNTQGSEIRLYRQNLGVFDDYLMEWKPASLSPSMSEPVGEGPRNAEDLIAGRITRQGGLLEAFPNTELPKTIEDNIRSSGVSDPGLAFPTITYVTRGGLGVFDYLRRPIVSSACANMAQSLLRVEHSSADDTLGQNIIVVSPVEDPEQAPLIYAIPVVTERQDEVIDIRGLRDSAIVFMTTSALRINYIPFDGNNQQDRVLTQISSNHGVEDNRRGALVETQAGQVLVWLSQTSIMASNGRGVWDMCPDFSVERAEKLGYDFSRPIFVNNTAEHRLELWTGPVRWDFLYHRTHLKDIRGDGAGLSLKLMGPTAWYDDSTSRKGGTVRSACSGVLDDKFRTFHTFEESAGGKVLAISNDTAVERPVNVRTRKFWGSDPTSRLRHKRAGVQHGNDVTYINIEIENTSPATQAAGAGSDEEARLQLDFASGFSDRFIREGLGSSGVYPVTWGGGAIGPLWVQTSEAPGGSGR